MWTFLIIKNIEIEKVVCQGHGLQKVDLPAPEGPDITKGSGPSPLSSDDASAPDADSLLAAAALWVGAMMKGAWITILPPSLPVSLVSDSVGPLLMLISKGRGYATQ